MRKMKTNLGKNRSLKITFLSILLSIAMLINVIPISAYASSGGTNAIINYNQAVDVIINADNSYTGNLSNFKGNLNTKLKAAGVNARIVTKENNISMDNLDNWLAYDHYYAPSYSTDGTIPSEWNSYSGRHPYYYYKEEYVDTSNITEEQFYAAEAAMHDTLYAEYLFLVYICQDDDYRLNSYYTDKEPYSSLTEEKRAALEPELLPMFNYSNGLNGNSLAESIELYKNSIVLLYFATDDYASLTDEQKQQIDEAVYYRLYYCYKDYKDIAYKALDDSSKKTLADEYLGTQITDYATMTSTEQAAALTNYKNVYYDSKFSGYMQAGDSFATMDETQKELVISQYYYNYYIKNNEDVNEAILSNAELSYYYTDLTGTESIHYRDRHIYTTTEDDGSTSMTFLGYGSPEYKDFKIYPSSLEVQKTVDFDIDASKVSTHTLEGAGFLINSGIDSLGYIYGYIMLYKFSEDSSGTGTLCLLKINDNITADALHQGTSGECLEDYCTKVGEVPFTFDSTSMKKHVSINISPTAVTCTDTDYTDAAGTTLSSTVNTLFDGISLSSTGYNGFGPIASYYSHSCEEISAFTFSGLKMNFLRTPADSLRGATYKADGDIPKIFINLTGVEENAFTDMTNDEKAEYYEMQSRMAQDHIYYVTTGGNTLIDSINGNGLDLSDSSESVTDTSNYIKAIVDKTTNWIGVNLLSLDAATLSSGELLPTAIFDVVDKKSGSSVLAIDRRYVGSGITLTYGNLDKSISRATDTAGDAFLYTYKIFDPSGNEITLSGSNELMISQSSSLGDYTFALSVTDSKTRTSKTALRTVQVSGVAVPITPAEPSVTVDDINNKLIGADATMEYSTDGGTTWYSYNQSDSPTFIGNVTVKVRVKAEGINPAGEITAVSFTANSVTPVPTSVPESSLPENKTITVVESPKSIPSSEMITVEPIGVAFDQSIEVRLKDDKASESTIRATMEATSSTFDAKNVQIFPLDISLYIKGTETKVQPAEGTAVKITCPIPTELLAQKDKLVVVSVIDGKLQIIETTVITKDGVSCAEFIATHFSPYAFVLDTEGKLAGFVEGNTATNILNSIKVATKMTVSAGTLTKCSIQNLPESATVAYHVCTPTYISINNKGEIFAKKTGKAILMAAITVDKTTTMHTITITVKKAKEVSKVGVIQYYDDLITYKNINYRITLKANKTTAGTVAVGNNQLNKKLSTKVVIPSKIALDGKTYYVTSIDESAFYNVNSIESVSIPDTMKNISETAFTACDNLKTFIVKSGNLNYTAKKGMLLDKTGTRLIAYPSASGKVVLGSKITTIGAYAFSACKNLNEIIIPKTVTKIEGCAFAHSKSLTKVTFQSITAPEIPFLCICEGVNKGCEILVPDKAINLYQTAFENARQPKGVVIMKK